MNIGSQGLPKKTLVLSLQSNVISVSPPVTGSLGALSIGDGPFDGVSTGKFTGSTSGTLIAANAATDFAGNLIDLQVAGSGTVFQVDASGNVTANNIAYNNQSNSFTAGQTVDTDALNMFRVRSSLGTNWFAVRNNVNGTIYSFSNELNWLGVNFLSIADGGGTLSGTSGNQNYLALYPTITQSSTAGYTGILVSSTENTTGSGSKLLLDLQVGNISKFSISNVGRVISTSNSQWSISQNASLGSNSDFFTIDNAGGNGSLNGGTGTQQSFVTIRPNIAQSSTAAYTGLEVDVTESATGSGSKLLLDLQVGDVSKFSVSNLGTVVTAGTLPAASLSGTVPAASLANAKSKIPCFIPTFGIRAGPLGATPAGDGVLLGQFTATAVGSCRRALTGGTAFTDLTAAANNATTSDVTFTFAAVNDALYIGHATLKYTAVKIKYTTASVYTATLVWEYWNGSAWSTLLTTTPTFLVDATATTFPATGQLKAAAGTYFVTFQPPSDWASTTVNTVAAFYVRLRVSAFTSLTTALAADQIWVYPVTAGTGTSAGQRGNITRIDFNSMSPNTGATTDTKLLIINGTTGVMYLFTATKGVTNITDTTINLAVAETDQILIQQIQQNAAAITPSLEFSNVNMTMTITPS